MITSVSSKKELIAYLIRNKYIVMHNFIETLPDEVDKYNLFIKGLSQYQLVNNDSIKVFDKNFEYYLNQFSVKNMSNNNSQKSPQTSSSNNNFNNPNNLNNSNQSTNFYTKILNEIEYIPNKKNVQHFIDHYKHRIEKIKPYLMAHKELSGVVSIKKLSPKSREVSLIGIVYDFKETKNGNLIITLEDETGMMTCILSKNKKEIFDAVKNEIVLDEVIGLTGVLVKDAVFVNEIIFPDIPLSKELSKLNEDSYAVFFSDVHLGSALFLKDEFERFIQWINGNLGSDEQKSIAQKTKYVFIVGDIVAGVGIYPGQEKELLLPDIYDQYDAFFEYMKQIPKSVKVVICPGNHDAMRLSEPQPAIPDIFTKSVIGHDNIMFVTNPAYLEIGVENSPNSLTLLLYHGASFYYYFDKIPSLRYSGGYTQVIELMKILLKKRHLAPSHTSTLYIPGVDYLAIDKIPDVFVSGHVHIYKSAVYRNITLINGSCWEAKTTYQEKMGSEPEPGKIAVMNLQTRKLKTINFI